MANRPWDAPDLVQTPLVENLVLPEGFDAGRLSSQHLLGPRTGFPAPAFASAKKSRSGHRLPQAIAHRGYKMKFPENTMGAFKGAVEVGAEAIETDIHLTKDDVVVLSHDKDLKRCFGRKEKIIDCDYDYLSKLKTLKEPHEAMPRLMDLLEYLARPGLEDIWLLLDIKVDNNAENVMRLIGSTIAGTQPAPGRPWSSRIVLGIWTAKYLELCARYLPNFAITHIGFSITYASYFFSVPNVSFNMNQASLMTPWGKSFLRRAQCNHRPVFAWTVNEGKRMRWDIRHGIDGVITDDPKLFLEVRKGWHEGMRERLGLFIWLDVFRMNLFALLLTLLFLSKPSVREVAAFVRPRAKGIEG